MTNTLENKVAIVTGASSGIGWQTAIFLAQRGCHLVITARREPLLIQLAETINKQKQGQCQFITLDLAERDAPEQLIDMAIEHYGRIDILVNNAGFGQQNVLEEMKKEEVENLFSVNVLSAIQASRLAIPYLKKNQGVILNIASVAGLIPLPLWSLYSSSKHALIGFSESLKYELEPEGVRVIAICPGPVQTEFFEYKGGIPLPKWLDESIKKKVDTPENVARNIVKAAFHSNKSGIVYGSWKSRRDALSYFLAKPLIHLMYRWYVRKVLGTQKKEKQ